MPDIEDCYPVSEVYLHDELLASIAISLKRIADHGTLQKTTALELAEAVRIYLRELDEGVSGRAEMKTLAALRAALAKGDAS